MVLSMDKNATSTTTHENVEGQTASSKLGASILQPKSGMGLLSGFLPGVVAAGEQRVPADQAAVATSNSRQIASGFKDTTTQALSSTTPLHAAAGSSKSYGTSDEEFRPLPVKLEAQHYQSFVTDSPHASKRDWTSAFTADDHDDTLASDNVSGHGRRVDGIPKLRSTGPPIRADDDSLSSKLLPGDVHPRLISSSGRIKADTSSPPPRPLPIPSALDTDVTDSLLASETAALAETDEDEFAVQQNELEMAMSDVPTDSMPEEKMKLSLLLANLSEDQLERYEVFRRSCFSRNNVKRIMQTITGTAVAQNVIIAMCGMAKVFVGEVVEEALDVQTQWDEEGSGLEPKHIREAVRRLKIDLS